LIPGASRRILIESGLHAAYLKGIETCEDLDSAFRCVGLGINPKLKLKLEITLDPNLDIGAGASSILIESGFHTAELWGVTPL